MRVFLVASTLVSMLVPSSLAQGSLPASTSAPGPPTFDVISVKMDKGDLRRRGSQFTSDGFRMVNMPVHNLLTQAFKVNPDQIIGEPGWATTDRWDVEAKVLAPTDVAMLGKMSFAQRQPMLLQILTDRFALKVHHEQRQLPVYALVVGKGGLKMVESKPDPESASKGGMPQIMGPDGKLVGQMVSLDFLAEELSWQTGRTVVDRTGLTGRYDFTLNWTPDLKAESAAAQGGNGIGDQASGESIFTAVQEQLGLKLQSTKALIDVIVIDHLEKPTEN